MTPFEIWKKMIEAKTFTRQIITSRINVIFAVGQINEEEYTELINLIGEKYID